MRVERRRKKELPVVMTTPANTFRRACGDVKLSVSSLNLSTTRRETASARTWGGNKYADVRKEKLQMKWGDRTLWTKQCGFDVIWMTKYQKTTTPKCVYKRKTLLICTETITEYLNALVWMTGSDLRTVKSSASLTALWVKSDLEGLG